LLQQATNLKVNILKLRLPMHNAHKIFPTGVHRMAIQVTYLAKIFAALAALMFPLVVAHCALMRTQIGTGN